MIGGGQMCGFLIGHCFQLESLVSYHNFGYEGGSRNQHLKLKSLKYIGRVIKYFFPKYDWAVAGYELCNTTRLVPQYFMLIVVIEYMVNLVH